MGSFVGICGHRKKNNIRLQARVGKALLLLSTHFVIFKIISI